MKRATRIRLERFNLGTKRWRQWLFSPKAQVSLFAFLFAGLALLYLMSFPMDVHALPAYSRLFHAKYGYKVSCYLCHQTGGGSAINDYGKDFKRTGFGFSAYAKIEKRDSDNDNFENIAEIIAKANPGDPRSVPKVQGDWLERIEESFIPKDQLAKLFPEASFYTLLEGTLNDEQVAKIEALLGRSLGAEEKVPTFYFAFTGAKEQPQRIGLGFFASPKGLEGPMMLGIGISLKGEVTKLVIYKSDNDKKTFNEVFLEQFRGKTQLDSFKAGEGFMPIVERPDISQDIAESIKLSLFIMYQVFARR